jgi:hypothetical protein
MRGCLVRFYAKTFNRSLVLKVGKPLQSNSILPVYDNKVQRLSTSWGTRMAFGGLGTGTVTELRECNKWGHA